MIGLIGPGAHSRRGNVEHERLAVAAVRQAGAEPSVAPDERDRNPAPREMRRRQGPRKASTNHNRGYDASNR
jgi:hypothetical protein